jgi:hypothetical protein
MHLGNFGFGSLCINATRYEHDLIIDRGKIRKRKKRPSKRFREEFGHTPLSIEEQIPWKCRRLVIGTGAYGRLPVMQEVKQLRHNAARWSCSWSRPEKPSSSSRRTLRQTRSFT